MTFATIDALRESLAQPAYRVRTPEYAAKMLHDLPDAPTVDRAKFILAYCKGKRVLEFGASGPLHDALLVVADDLLGVDREAGDHVVAFDLDDVSQQTLPANAPDVIVCGEVLEHLANPGWFLSRLHRQFAGVPVIISVPNAFSSIAQKHVAKGTENVNRDHTCWYSPRTLRTLLERYDYAIESFHWYGGEPGTAEGFVVVAK